MKILLAIAATMTALIGGTANADTVATVTAYDQAPTRVVAYGDLDLTAPAGMATLTRRVRSAALAVCGGNEGNDLASRSANRACRTKAQTTALKTIADRTAPTVYASR